MDSKKSLSAKDISVIIKACKSSGVRSLQYDGLVIEFGPETVISHDKLDQHFTINDLNVASEAVSLPSFDQDDSEEDDLIVTNPTAWEEYRSKQE